MNVEHVGPSWGSQITNKALEALIVFFILVSVYISIFFEWRMALAAILAMFHDILVTVGVYSLVGFDVTPDTVVAFLTILGYSLYDTIVVFDRVRDNAHHLAQRDRIVFSDLINLSMNQTLARSLNTSLVAILPILSVLVLGAQILGATTLQYFGLALLIGLTTGAYSSIFIASPLVAMMKEREPHYRQLTERLHKRGIDRRAPQPGRRRRRRPRARAARRPAGRRSGRHPRRRPPRTAASVPRRRAPGHAGGARPGRGPGPRPARPDRPGRRGRTGPGRPRAAVAKGAGADRRPSGPRRARPSADRARPQGRRRDLRRVPGARPRLAARGRRGRAAAGRDEAEGPPRRRRPPGTRGREEGAETPPRSRSRPPRRGATPCSPGSPTRPTRAPPTARRTKTPSSCGASVTPPVFSFEPRDHLALGSFAVDKAAQLSGARFAYRIGDVALVELALYRYALGRALAHGFTPVLPPVLVRESAMFGTGFLPTDEANLYRVEPDGLYLTGTSEVALAGLHAGEILEAETLPRRYAGYSTCFRREAGAAGRDTRGIFRVHQFDKVEMFVFATPGAVRRRARGDPRRRGGDHRRPRARLPRREHRGGGPRSRRR